MQKKLIALAVAALASGAAFAQTNVTVYGSVDMGISHRGDNIAKGVSGKNAIDSGISAGNRLGFRGVEDLGNGISALFTLEAGFNADDGEHTQSGRLFGRQAFMGLTGGFGTVIAGRLYTPHYSLLSAIDPFKAGTVGQYRNVFAAGVTTGGENLFDPTRVDNTLAYVTPSWGGFNVTLAYSTNAIGQEALENYGDNRVWAILPRYTNGPLDIGVSYHQIKSKDKTTLRFGNGTVADPYWFTSSKLVDIKNWAVGGSYDFGAVKLHAFYDQNKFNDILGLDNTYKLKSWLLGVTVPFGKHAIQGSWTQSKLSGVDGFDGKARQFAVGYTYALSKRTNFYAAYSDIANRNDRKRGANPTRALNACSAWGTRSDPWECTGALNFGGINAAVGDSSNGGAGYQNGLQIGLKHTF